MSSAHESASTPERVKRIPYLRSLVNPASGNVRLPGYRKAAFQKSLAIAANVTAGATGNGLFLVFPCSVRKPVVQYQANADGTWTWLNTIVPQDISNVYDYGIVNSAIYTVTAATQATAGLLSGTFTASMRIGGPSELSVSVPRGDQASNWPDTLVATSGLTALPSFDTVSNLTTVGSDKIGACPAQDGVAVLAFPNNDAREVRLGDPAPAASVGSDSGGGYVGPNGIATILGSRVYNGSTGLVYQCQFYTSGMPDFSGNILNTPSDPTSWEFNYYAPIVSLNVDTFSAFTATLTMPILESNAASGDLAVGMFVYGLSGTLMDFAWLPKWVDFPGGVAQLNNRDLIEMSFSFPSNVMPAYGASWVGGNDFPEPVGNIQVMIGFTNATGTLQPSFGAPGNPCTLRVEAQDADLDASTYSQVTYIGYQGLLVNGTAQTIVVSGMQNMALIPNLSLAQNIPTTFTYDGLHADIYDVLRDHRDELGLKSVWNYNDYKANLPRIESIQNALDADPVAARSFNFGAFLGKVVKALPHVIPLVSKAVEAFAASGTAKPGAPRHVAGVSMHPNAATQQFEPVRGDHPGQAMPALTSRAHTHWVEPSEYPHEVVGFRRPQTERGVQRAKAGEKELHNSEEYSKLAKELQKLREQLAAERGRREGEHEARKEIQAKPQRAKREREKPMLSSTQEKAIRSIAAAQVATDQARAEAALEKAAAQNVARLDEAQGIKTESRSRRRGSEARLAAMHNKMMHAANGNIDKPPDANDGADASRAAAHNKVMHAINGNTYRTINHRTAGQPWHVVSEVDLESSHGQLPTGACIITWHDGQRSRAIPWYLNMEHEFGDDVNGVVVLAPQGVLFPTVMTDVELNEIGAEPRIAVRGAWPLFSDAGGTLNDDGHMVYGGLVDVGDPDVTFPSVGCDMTLIPVVYDQDVVYAVGGRPAIGHSCDAAIVLAAENDVVRTPPVFVTGSVHGNTVGSVLGVQTKNILAQHAHMPFIGGTNYCSGTETFNNVRDLTARFLHLEREASVARMVNTNHTERMWHRVRELSSTALAIARAPNSIESNTTWRSFVELDAGLEDYPDTTTADYLFVAMRFAAGVVEA